MAAVRRLSIPLILVSSALLAGCAAKDVMRSSASAALTDVIETVTTSELQEEKTPLVLPASIVILFVPSSDRTEIPRTSLHKAAEALKQQLTGSRYIRSVQVVADAELQEKITLERIRRLYGADIALLLSYQQDQFSSQKGWVGLADITIIGAFVIPGVVTKTATVVDGKVIHIPNDAMIFRADGSNERTAYSPAADQRETLRKEAIAGVLAATADLGRSLLKTLASFDQYDLARAVPMSVVVAGEPAGAGSGKRSNDYWERVEGFKSSGGGALGSWWCLIAVLACWAAWRRR